MTCPAVVYSIQPYFPAVSQLHWAPREYSLVRLLLPLFWQPFLPRIEGLYLVLLPLLRADQQQCIYFFFFPLSLFSCFRFHTVSFQRVQTTRKICQSKLVDNAAINRHSLIALDLHSLYTAAQLRPLMFYSALQLPPIGHVYQKISFGQRRIPI